MIVLALVLAYAVYEFVLVGDPSNPSNPSNPNNATGFTAGRVATQPNQNISQPPNQAVRQVSQATLGTRTFQPPPDLELRDDPFFRSPSLTKAIADTQAQSGALTGLRFHGTFANNVLINDTPYKVNDIIMGFTILEFTSERVILSDSEGKRHVLRKN